MARKEWPRPLQRKPRRLASAALALALATTLAPSYFPSGVNQASAAPVVQPAALPQATPTADNQIIDADMIASGRVTKAANLTDAQGVGKGLISGHVYLTTPDGNPGAAYDNGNVKMDGITVYAQFRDKDGSYSPIFSAKTHTLPDVVGGNGGKGTFAFGTGKKGITWTDKLGREHTWAARTDQKHRIWVEPYTNKRGNRVEMFRQANGWTPGSFNGVVDGPMGSFVAADGNMQLMAAFMREVPPNHETSWMAAKGDKLVEDPKGPIKNASGQLRESNVLSGQVWLETGGSPDWGFPATGPKRDSVTQDPAADGYTVYASTLTKDGAAANAKLQAQFKNDPDKLSEETKKMLEAHPEYILKTVYGKTDPSGNYSLRFGDYTNKNQTREDFLNPNHVFVWVENKDGVVQNGYTGFHTPIFQRFDAGGNFKPADAVPAENQAVTSRVEDLNTPRYDKPVNSLYNVRHALMPYAPVSIKADYNATDKPAAPGTKVTPEFSGELSSLPSKIEWRDQKGKVLKTCELDQSKGIKAQVAACTFDIPADAKKGDVFNVVVVSGGNDVAAWTVLVTKDSDEYTPAYEEKLVVPGKETKSSPKFTDKNGKDAKAPEGSKFAIPGDFKAPEGYVVTIDESTGEITVTFPDKSKLSKDTVEEFDVPVTVTYPDGSKDEAPAKFKLDTDGDGTPDVTDPDDDNDGIPDKDDSNPKVPNQNDHFEPGYEDGSGKPGEDVTVPAPEFKDKDGKDTKAPEGTKFTPGENVPGGVKIDEKTGEITVTIPGDAKPGDKITVPVVVTYPDGTTDTVDVTVTVEKPDAPETDKPDWKDDSGKPGDKVEIPNTGGDVPDGSTVETEGPGKAEIDKDGNIVVDIDKDAKPGDKIVVVVKDKDGNEIDTVTVTVEKPDAPETTKPDWNDGKTTPDKPIVIPNTGGKVPDGATVEVTGPGTAEIGEDGSITVTPSDKAKVGDKIVVVVKDKDGNVLDTITVEITDGELKPEGSNGDKLRPGMPHTGADDSAAGALALGGALAAIAAGVGAARRRRY